MKSDLLKIRNERKANKPDFIRQEINKRKRLKLKWRNPKGMHSKLRRKFRGKRKMPSIGYGSPKKFKGTTNEGKKKVLIHNLMELNKLKVGEVIELAKLGSKKRLEILKKIREKKFKITNVKDIQASIKKIEDNMVERKKRVEERKKKKEKAKEEKKPKKEKKKEDKEVREKKEKEEKRKTLEKR